MRDRIELKIENEHNHELVEFVCGTLRTTPAKSAFLWCRLIEESNRLLASTEVARPRFAQRERDNERENYHTNRFEQTKYILNHDQKRKITEN